MKNVIFFALALAGCGVDTTPMFSDGGNWDTDAYIEDGGTGTDGSHNQVDPTKRDTGVRPNDSGQVFVPDADVELDASDTVDGAVADATVDSGTDAATPLGGQCAPCTSNDQCLEGYCTAQPGTPGRCLNTCSGLSDPFCNTDNGLRCQTRCVANTNFFPGGCTEWFAWWEQQ